MKHQVSLLVLIFFSFIAVGCTTRLPVHAVQLADDDGSNQAPITREQVKVWVDNANLAYTKSDYELVFDSSPNSPDFDNINLKY
jgi:hypothetical protein